MAQQKRGGGGARKRRSQSPGPPAAADSEGRLSVLVELRSERGGSQSMAASQAAAIEVPGFELDHEFQVVPLGENQEGLTPVGTAESFVVRGTVADEAEMDGLRSDPNVVNVWRDTPIAPFATPARELQTGEGMATCPIPPCDCDPATPRGHDRRRRDLPGGRPGVGGRLPRLRHRRRRSSTAGSRRSGGR